MTQTIRTQRPANLLKHSLAAATLSFVMALPAQAAGYQAGLMTDYLFRGLTRTDHGPAVYLQGKTQRGDAYASVKAINIDTPDGAEGLPVEMDVSFGYNNRFDSFNIDVEVITYNFLVDSMADETEFKLGTRLAKGLDLELYRGIKGKTWYPEISYEKFLKNRLYLDGSVGFWKQDDADDTALTARLELGRDFPEFHGIDIYGGLDFISDSTPFGNDADKDDSELEFVLGIRKNF